MEGELSSNFSLSFWAKCTNVPVTEQVPGWSPFSWPINLAGLPAATVPCGWDREGLPIGLQIVAPWLAEDTILAVAAALEQAQPWADAWPALDRA